MKNKILSAEEIADDAASNYEMSDSYRKLLQRRIEKYGNQISEIKKMGDGFISKVFSFLTSSRYSNKIPPTTDKKYWCIVQYNPEWEIKEEIGIYKDCEWKTENGEKPLYKVIAWKEI